MISTQGQENWMKLSQPAPSDKARSAASKISEGHRYDSRIAIVAQVEHLASDLVIEDMVAVRPCIAASP